MKREFLQNLKVGDQPLPKEVIDAIMAENGRDIEAAKKPYEDYDTVKQQLADAQKTLEGFKDQGTDLETMRKKAEEWERKFNKAVEDHKQQMADRDFQQKLEAAITGKKGKNAKAIKALLDVDALKGSKNQDADIKAAMDALQKDSGYLFGDVGNPPTYSPGAGTGAYQGGSGSDATLRAAMGLPAKNN